VAGNSNKARRAEKFFEAYIFEHCSKMRGGLDRRETKKRPGVVAWPLWWVLVLRF
jgi:hypothetical protein